MVPSFVNSLFLRIRLFRVVIGVYLFLERRLTLYLTCNEFISDKKLRFSGDLGLFRLNEVLHEAGSSARNR